MSVNHHRNRAPGVRNKARRGVQCGRGGVACLSLLALRATNSSISVILVSRMPIMLSCG